MVLSVLLPTLKIFQPNVPWADWEETRSPTEERQKLPQGGHWSLAVPMKSPQGHRYLRVEPQGGQGSSHLCRGYRLVPGLELLAYSLLMVSIIRVVSGIQGWCQAGISWGNGSQH